MTADTPAPNAAPAPPPPNTPTPAPTEAPVTPLNLPPLPKRKWGEPSPPEAWLKLRDLVGHSFRVVKIRPTVITPKKGERAGESRPSFVFELSTGHLFSVNETDTIGKEIAGFGMPDLPAVFKVVSTPSTVSRTGDSLSLRTV